VSQPPPPYWQEPKKSHTAAWTIAALLVGLPLIAFLCCCNLPRFFTD
jgi:hypothetical protein